MGNKPTRLFTKVEMEFMQILWEKGELPPEDIRAELDKKGRSLSNGGTRRILSILCRKGHVSRRKEGRHYLYRTLVNKKQAFRNIFVDLKKRIFGDSGVLMAAAFLDSYVVNDSEIDEIQLLFEKHVKDKNT